MKSRIVFEGSTVTFIAEPENEYEIQMLRMLGCDSAPLTAQVEGALEIWRTQKEVRMTITKQPSNGAVDQANTLAMSV